MCPNGTIPTPDWWSSQVWNMSIFSLVSQHKQNERWTETVFSVEYWTEEFTYTQPDIKHKSQSEQWWASVHDDIWALFKRHRAVSALLLQRHHLLAKSEDSIACSVCVLTREPHNALQWAQIYLVFTFVPISIWTTISIEINSKLFWSCKKKCVFLKSYI